MTKLMTQDEKFFLKFRMCLRCGGNIYLTFAADPAVNDKIDPGAKDLTDSFLIAGVCHQCNLIYVASLDDLKDSEDI